MSDIHFLLPLVLILVTARVVGRVSRYLGMPGVLGELLAGLLLGPSLLGWVKADSLIEAVAGIGVLLLMFIAGLETDPVQLRRAGRAAVGTAMAGVMLPFVGGLGVGRLLGLDGAGTLFLGAVLTATSVSVSVQTLYELGHLRSRVGAVVLGAAVLDDVLAILVLSLVLAMAGQSGSVWVTLGRMALFFPVAIGLGRLGLRPLLRWADGHLGREAGFALILAVVLFYAWSAEAWGGLAAITGAYVAGVLMARLPEARHWIAQGAGMVGYGVFVPVFFVAVGLSTDLGALGAASWATVGLVVVAVLTKWVGGGLGARLGGCTWREAGAIGAGMVARGEVALVMAGLGRSSGLLTEASFAVVVLMTLATTLLTPLCLRLVLPRRGESPEGGVVRLQVAE
ncbi:MAG: cation:proton antiporter [Anaerolineae bacterium]|nr:cation:proton antiporter [Caldilineales bacterium]MCX7852203.1 cation:proton antiporter [Caldilineales bacterium]MDW8268584.1 cation:proton antiporter [Anaerolineae bacterium]